MAERKPDGRPPDSERTLRFAAVLASILIIGAVVILDVARDGILEATSIGLLTGVLGPVITILLLKGSSK